MKSCLVSIFEFSDFFYFSVVDFDLELPIHLDRIHSGTGLPELFSVYTVRHGITPRAGTHDIYCPPMLFMLPPQDSGLSRDLNGRPLKILST